MILSKKANILDQKVGKVSSNLFEYFYATSFFYSISSSAMLGDVAELPPPEIC